MLTLWMNLLQILWFDDKWRDNNSYVAVTQCQVEPQKLCGYQAGPGYEQESGQWWYKLVEINCWINISPGSSTYKTDTDSDYRSTHDISVVVCFTLYWANETVTFKIEWNFTEMQENYLFPTFKRTCIRELNLFLSFIV